MPATKNLCAQISLDLHQKISEAREQSDLTTAQYITNLLIEYYEMKKNGGNTTMANGKNRTLAFQIDETLFQRIKVHLDRETARTGRKLTQREFVLGLIEEALEAAERQAGETRLEPEDAPQPHTGSDAEAQEGDQDPTSQASSGSCGAQEDGGIPQDLNPASQDGDEPCEDWEDLPDSQDQ